MLCEVFGFSTEDLHENRAGRMSDAQKWRILQTHERNSRFAWGAFAVILGVGFLGFSADMIRSGQMGSRALFAYAGFTAIIGAVVWAYVRFYRGRMRLTLVTGRMHSVSGPLRIVAERREKLLHWTLRVGDQQFALERADHRIRLQNSGILGRHVTVYYSMPWHGLLSVEVQRQEEPAV